MTCEHCSDTGSLRKDVGGHWDCPYCDVAQQRTDLENWHKTVIKPQQLPVQDVLWLAVLRERQLHQTDS